MYSGKRKTNSNIAWHRQLSAGARQEEDLIHKSTRALSSATDPLDKLHLSCFSRGATGILDLVRVFRKIDDGSKQLNKEKFINALKESGFYLSNKEADELFEMLDTDNSGWISLDEFVNRIRPPMSESRCNILEQAFKKLDKTGEGAITIDDIRRLYSVVTQQSTCTRNPFLPPGLTRPPTWATLSLNIRYRSGEESADIILNRFLEHFESGGTVDGKVTFEEFMNYYIGISVSIDTDCYFDLMMRQAYLL